MALDGCTHWQACEFMEKIPHILLYPISQWISSGSTNSKRAMLGKRVVVWDIHFVFIHTPKEESEHYTVDTGSTNKCHFSDGGTACSLKYQIPPCVKLDKRTLKKISHLNWSESNRVGCQLKWLYRTDPYHIILS